MTDRLAIAQQEFKPVLAALKAHAAALAALPGVAVVRPGYSIAGDEKQPVLALALHPDRPTPETAALAARFGVRVIATAATPEEQILGMSAPSFVSPLRAWLEPSAAATFGEPKRGTYQPPSGAGAPTLDTIEEQMHVTVCASPDAGWPVLRDFLGEGVKDRLTVAMYDISATHIEDALLAVFDGTDATFRLVLDGQKASGGVGSNGINGDDNLEADIVARIAEALGDRFEIVRASVGKGKAVPKAYHIKVACADGERVWLSSGNWQSSNQPFFDYTVAGSAPKFPLSRYNRDYHVVARSPSLAATYAQFIEYDATLGDDFAEASFDEPLLLVPDELAEPEDFAPAQRFPPGVFDEVIRVTPLLTPDNFPAVVNALLKNARARVWIQNQYIMPDAEGDNFPELDELIANLGDLAERVDLRLQLRSLEDVHRDRLLAAGVKLSQIRAMKTCHAKVLVIDDNVVVVGSQNMSNLGFVANRDASLAFEHEGINSYFATILDHDWQRAKPKDDGDSFAVRVVGPNDPVPAGFRRVPWSEVFDGPPPAMTAAVAPKPAPTADPGVLAALEAELQFFGVDEDGRRLSEKTADVAAAVRGLGGAIEPALGALGKMLETEAFGVLPVGAMDGALADMGWGVVWGPGVAQDVKDALKPLLDHRRIEVGDELLFHELDYVAGEDLGDFLERHGGEAGAIKPASLPYYLMLVGSPEAIPWKFQTLLDGEYRVGRLDLDSAADYGRYAKSVVAVETDQVKPPRDRKLHSFGTAHTGDAPTKLSERVLVQAAPGWLTPKLRQKFALDSAVDDGELPTKARLLEILGGAKGRPELLYTAGHGLTVASGNANQRRSQGALVTADWSGFGPIDAECLFAASDVPAGADVHGMVAFLFACFGAGTPETDSFPTRAGQPLAPKPFVAALPKALLSHPKGAALGVFGHVDRTLVWSLLPPDAQHPTTEALARAAQSVLAGERLGAALDALNQKAATFAQQVAAALQPGAPPTSDIDLMRDWIQQRDATAFVLIGDPAARLPRA